MYSHLILIIGKKEEIAEIKEKIKPECKVIFQYAETEKEAIEKVSLLEPDLIIISFDQDKFNVFSLCANIRNVVCLTRPVVLLEYNSLSNNDVDKITGFKLGADDYIDISLPEEEFSVRIFAQLRRHVQELSNQTTLLPSFNIINSNIQRRISLGESWAMMILKLDHYEFYEERYGSLAATQMMKAFIAIAKAHLEEDDFIGHIGNQDFVILTNPSKAEVLAKHICETFDQIIPKFYAPFEAERKYTIVTNDDRTSRKIPLVSVNIGIVSSPFRKIDNYHTAINIGNNMGELAKSKEGSGWILDRPLIPVDQEFTKKSNKPYILVAEADAALAYLLTTTLQMNNFNVDATSNKKDAIELINTNKPDLIIIDATIPGDESWEICNYVRNDNMLVNTKIIMTTVLKNEEKAFAAGIDLYIQKPYDIISLHKWIDYLIKERQI